MKKIIEIKKSKYYGEIDYSALLNARKYGSYNFEYEELNDITLNGNLCFFDAFSFFDSYKPFDAVFPLRATPFALSVSTSEGKRVAFAGLRFGKNAVEHIIAYSNRENLLRLQSDVGSIGVSVPSGVICIGDNDAYNTYRGIVKDGSLHPLDGVIDLDGFVRNTFQLKDNKSVAVFSTGWGDGNFPAYIGYDSNGAIADIIVDFGMIEPKKKDNAFVKVELDIELDKMYVYDPKLDDSENNILRWSLVIDNTPLDDYNTLFNAYSRRGFSYHSIKKLDEALWDYEKAIGLIKHIDSNSNKINAWALYDNAGNIFRELNKIDKAVAIFEDALQYGDSFYAGAYLSLIDIYISQKQPSKALEIALKMTKERPQDATAFFRCAEIYVSLEDYNSAADCYDVLIKTFKLEECIIDKVACLLALKRYAESEECLKSYLEDNKANELYYYHLGLIRYKTKCYDLAYADLIKAYELNPDYIPTLHLLIEIDEMFFNYNAIIKWSTKFIELRPNSEFGYFIRADSFIKTGRFDAAIHDILYLIVHISHDSSYYALLVGAYSLKGDYGKARKYARAIPKDSGKEFFSALGRMYLIKGKYEKSEKYFKAASVGSETGLIDLMILYIHWGKYAEALNIGDSIIDQYVANFEVYALKVRTMILMGNEDSARKVMDEYIHKFFSESPDANLIERIYNTMINYHEIRR